MHSGTGDICVTSVLKPRTSSASRKTLLDSPVDFMRELGTAESGLRRAPRPLSASQRTGSQQGLARKVRIYGSGESDFPLNSRPKHNLFVIKSRTKGKPRGKRSRNRSEEREDSPGSFTSFSSLKETRKDALLRSGKRDAEYEACVAECGKLKTILETQTHQHAAELQSLRTELQVAREESAQSLQVLMRRKTKAKNEIRVLKTEVHSLKAQLNEVKSQANAQETQEQYTKSIETELQTAQKGWTSAQKTIRDLEEEKRNLDEQLRALNSSLQDREAALARLRTELTADFTEQVRKKNESCRKKEASLRKQLDTQNSATEEAKRRLKRVYDTLGTVTEAVFGEVCRGFSMKGQNQSQFLCELFPNQQECLPSEELVKVLRSMKLREAEVCIAALLAGNEEGKVTSTRLKSLLKEGSVCMNSPLDVSTQTDKEIPESNPIYISQLSSLLEHISLRLQLRRYAFPALRDLLFPSQSLTPAQTLYEKLGSPPLDISECIDKGLFILMCLGKSLCDENLQSGWSGEYAIAEKTMSLLEEKLGHWEVFTQTEESDMDHEITSLLVSKGEVFRLTCQSYDTEASGFISEADFYTVLQAISLDFPPRIRSYLRLLFYSQNRELATVPYSDFLSAYTHPTGMSTEEVTGMYLRRISEQLGDQKVSEVFAANTSGIVSANHFRAGLTALGIFITRKEEFSALFGALESEEGVLLSELERLVEKSKCVDATC